MDKSVALRIAKRFITLPLDKRALYLEKMREEGVSVANLPIPEVRSTFAELPLSYAQERQWFLWQLEPDSAAYHIPTALRLHGALDIPALERSFSALVARHESLRTQLHDNGQGPRQVVVAPAALALDIESVPAGLEPAAREAWVKTTVEAETRRLFDLRNGPLLRVRLLRLAAEEHVLVLTLHHIVSDGWSSRVLVDELVHCYGAYSQGREPQLPALEIQYADYAIWQRHWMEAGERERQLAYWREQLGDEHPVLELPGDYPRPAQRSYLGGRLQLDLPQALVDELKHLAQREGVTLFMLLLASFQTLLHRYSGQRDIRVGVPVANRNRVETEGLIGFFVNTQVLKADIDGQAPFLQVLQQVKQAALGAQAHQDLPFEQLVEALHPQRNASHSPLFQVVYNHQAAARADAGQAPAGLGGLRIEGLEAQRETAQFDLTLDTFEAEHGLWATLSYASDLFERASAERIGRHWLGLLQGIVAQPQQRVGDLPLLSAGEWQATLNQWNPQPRSFLAQGAAHQLIEAQVERTPQAIALTFEGQHLSYRELNARANRLAHRLIAAGVGPDVLVGLASRRSLEMVVGLLAILKAGGAYVPLDPAYPQDRLRYMIDDSGIRLLLAQGELLDLLNVPETVQVIALEDASGADSATHNPQAAVGAENLAYVIYTSGSTGKPKGVLLPHGNILRLFDATQAWFGFGAQDVWSLFHSYAFDFSVWEIFGALLHGGRLLIVPQDTSRSAEEFYALLCAEQVTVLNQTPSAFKQLMQVACQADAGQRHALRYVVFGGEALEVKGLRPWFERFGEGPAQLVNMYGITETTVHVTYRPLTLADLDSAASSPIGEPIPDLSWYLLDAQLNPVAAGCVGELYVGRAGLARGYHRRGELTASRFVPDPFRTDGARLYRTGDLARYRSDGVIEYIGRLDHQVKIRGFRIELGEIEARLLAQSGVRQAAVLAQDGAAGAQLVAYVVGAESARDVLKAGLRADLPDYMVPAHILFLDQLPLTANGKLDRKALPDPQPGQAQAAFRAPQSAQEQALAAIWEDVLKVERIGLDDDFFELGGHSLLATQVVSRVRQQLGRQVALRSLFEQPTLGAFAQTLLVDDGQGRVQIPRLPAGQAQPLSFAQERQWFLWQLEPESAAYHIPMALRLKGPLDIAALSRSFDALIARHASLRTRFVEQGEQVLQVVEGCAALNLTVDSRLFGVNDEQALQRYVEDETRQLFDLLQGPLLRVRLLQLGAQEHVLVMTQHHIVSDGWSMQRMVEELIALYNGAELPELPIQYVDYAVWQRQWLAEGEQARQLAYWTEQLGGEQPVLELPTDRPRPPAQSYRGARQALQLNAELAQGLRELAQREQATLFMVLLASFQALLHRYSGQAEVRVGVPIANRNRIETEGLIGFFVNTQVLKADVDAQASFSTLLQQVKQAALGAQAHQDLPFEQLVEALQPERSLSHSPLFQVMFNHQNVAASAPNALGELQVEALGWESNSTQFDLTLNTFEGGDGLSASLVYATDLFDAATIARLGAHWQQLLRALVADSQLPVGQLSLISNAERNQAIEGWNATAQDYDLALTVQQRFEAQTLVTPNAPALVFGSTELTYAELNARANRLARKLVEQGACADGLVGIAVERSIEMVVGLLAILKAGAAYVPLDPEYPQDRLAYMIEDSGITLLLTQSHLLDNLPLAEGVRSLVLDQPDSWLAGYSDSNLGIVPEPEQLTYVIYTSGSTGKPKGAGNRHRALVNRLCWMQAAYGLGAADTVLQKTPFSFDVSVWEFFWPLMTGARLVVAAPGDHRDPARLIELIERHQVSTLHFVPSMLQAFLQDPNVGACRSLQRIVCSGEALPVDAQQQVLEKLPAAGLYNLYGPTEAAIDVTHWTCRDEGCDQVPIGEPIANLATYILDDELNPVPVGVAGELYLAGVGLARGYHRRPELTAERFVASPFVAGERLYRTGDLARYRSNGVIEYAGRIDHQVKIRGLRIELGEIEARLLEQGQLREAVVIACDGRTGKQLIAYVVPTQAEATPSAEQLAAHLLQQLPDYMVPAQFIVLERMPLSPNGKLERKALPAPQAQPAQQGYQAPANATERSLAAIWQGLLGLEQVGRNDNFFSLGGDSIISIQMIGRARQQGFNLSPRDVFKYQTIAGLATVAATQQALHIDQGPVSGASALVPIQAEFFASDIPERAHWNQSVLLDVHGSLDPQLLEQALQTLVSHHDALRLRFHAAVDGWHASYAELAAQSPRWQAAPLLWQAPASTAEEQAQAAQRSLDLAQGELLRGVLLSAADGAQQLLLVIHHLAVDGVSWRILLEDLQNLYRQLAAGQPVQLPAKTSAFKAWAECLGAYANSAALQAEADYWQAQVQAADASLPGARAQASLANQHRASVHSQLDQTLTRQLLQQAPQAYRTQVNDLLLTALARTLSAWTGADSALIQLEGHGREDLDPGIDLSRTVGWFSSLFPVGLNASGELGAAIKTVKEQLRAVPNKGIGFGALRYLGSPAVRERLAQLPLPRVTFNYLGQFDGSFEQAADALFSPRGERLAADQDSQAPLGNWLSINGQVYAGELSLAWSFSREMFDSATVQALADAFSAQLRELIAHCVAPQHRGVTPSDFALAQVTQAQLEQLPLAVDELEDLYPLSSMQQGMLFHTLEAAGDDLYINQTSVAVDGLDSAAFIRAWDLVISRHEILRTSFWSASGLAEPLQLVRKQARMPVQLLDWRDRAVSEADLQALAAADCALGFDLLDAPLMRLTLVRLDDNRQQLIWTSHHILMDGWSKSRLLGEVFEAYAGLPLPEKRGHYRDYIAWLQAQSPLAQEQFWKAKLQAIDGSTSLAASMAPQADASLGGHAALYLKWDPARTAHLREQARQLQVTPNTLIQAAWTLLLQRYTGQDCVSFGAIVAGRPAQLPASDEMLGLFINTLPIIQAPRADQRVAEWLQELLNYNLEVRDHEHSSLADIQRWSGQGAQALFDSIIVFENYPIDERLKETGKSQLQFGAVSGRDVTNYAMDLAVHLNDTLSIEFLYLRNRFTEQTCAQLMASFETLLQALLDSPQATLGSLGLLTASEQHALALGNRCQAPAASSAALLAEHIAGHARQQPDSVALVCAGQQLTYAQLEAQANRLAHYLIAQGVGPEMFVGVALQRSVEVIVAFYAVMKTGAAYVPLDIDYPRERFNWIVEDSAMAVLLTEQAVTARLGQAAVGLTLELDRLDLSAQATTCPPQRATGDNLAYLIYTSGSTGKPKGVAVAHGPIRMHCQAIAQRYEMSAQTRELLFMSFAFDGAQERWLSTLLCGGRLVIRDNRLWTPEETWQALHDHGISIACFPPAYLQQLAEFSEGREAPPVDIYCFGGDAVAEANFELVKRVLKPRCLTNGYGPTETVVTPLLWKVDVQQRCEAVYAPIGIRVGERTLYVLDNQLNPLPVGVAGELYIGGEGVARGYHQRPGLSAERFVADPFDHHGGRLYRTGDLVRQRADGVIDYLGRLDHQVKIRGFRIELGEIESRLRGMPGVRDAVVVARDSQGGKQLVGYVVADAQAGLAERLREALRADLPDYMVPSQLMLLDALPLNPNGKVDRKALPDPAFKGREYLAPRNAVEAGLAAIWQEVLEIEQVGVSDNFFELGGDSLRILKVLTRVRASGLGLELKLRDMMGKPTIAELSGYAGEPASLDPLLLLNRKVAQVPALFCLHAGFGTVFDYEPLARLFDGRRSVYGLQCRMLLDRDWQDDSLEAMAIDYAQYIRQKQADGPYHLLGWSLGGTLAVLVADELRRQGQDVAFVGLVDSYLPGEGVGQALDDYSVDLRDFLAVVSGHRLDTLPALGNQALPAEAQLQQLIGNCLAHAPAASDYARFEAQDLAHTFLVAMRLKQLSLQLQRLPALACETWCWWAAAVDAAARQRFETQLSGLQGSTTVAAGHFDILRHATLLDSLGLALGDPERILN